MSPITTHILDTSRGRAAEGVTVLLEQEQGGQWKEIGKGVTDADGRVKTLLGDDHVLVPGIYRLAFDTGHYFKRLAVSGFYPFVAVSFEIRAAGEHYHVPLLLNPFGYSTYRGT
jgi:5-hydroxyisourate hydrolase